MIKRIQTESHDEWSELRKHYIGGSDAGAVIGLNPYKSAYTLWAEKTGKIQGFDGNLTTKVGSYLEDFVAKLFEEETGKKVRKSNHSLTNDLYPFAIANLDRTVVGEDAFLEIKTTNSFPIMKQIREQEFPEAYYAQCVHYLAVTESKKCYLAVLINCRDFKVFELERDQAEIDALMNAEKEFWSEYVEKDTPPLPDGSDSSSETISQLYPESNDSQVDLFGFGAALEQYNLLTAQQKSIKEVIDSIANQIKEYMGEASRGVSPDYKVSYSSAERRTFDTKAFAQDHKDIDLDKYYKVSSYRTFKVTKIGDK